MSFAVRLFENKKGQGQLCNSTTETKKQTETEAPTEEKQKAKLKKETHKDFCSKRMRRTTMRQRTKCHLSS